MWMHSPCLERLQKQIVEVAHIMMQKEYHEVSNSWQNLSWSHGLPWLVPKGRWWKGAQVGGQKKIERTYVIVIAQLPHPNQKYS